jgi:hypothetical protein
MATLSREQRRDLENAVKQARRVAEAGARKAIEQLAVHHHEPWSSLTPEQRKLRNRLRAHGRQLGDKLDARTDRQEISRLVHECAYEHWHRMLFARFLADNNLLIEPDTGVPITLEECRELALERGTDWLSLASEFAVGMLPQIFRAGDPVLEIPLPPETRQELEQLLKVLPREVFLADDSLGWVYQFWQRDEKDRVNKAEVKIGADELPAVTQLFTEDYMVLFLLENTLGAWWTAKRRAEGKDPALPGYSWTYLRFNEDGSPAAGSFDGWPRAARDLRALDPCMGSGHFLVFALPILARMRMEEEGLSLKDAIYPVLRDNLFGLEIDPRCSQIAAFNLALAAWRMAGEHFGLPPLNLACSGLGIHAAEADWMKLGGEDSLAREEMWRLYSLFRDALTLGSLIDPLRLTTTVYSAGAERVLPLIEEALEREQSDEGRELAIAAQGVLAAFRILASRFSLVATNVPYLGRGKQDEVLAKYCAEFHSDAKADLATCFVDRCLRFAREGGSVALVTPQNWLFLTSYKKLRERLLKAVQWDFVARLGPRAFETISGEVVNVALLGLTRRAPAPEHTFAGWDVGSAETVAGKATTLQTTVGVLASQEGQLANPGAAVALVALLTSEPLGTYANVFYGSKPGQTERVTRKFWELPSIDLSLWAFLESSPNGEADYTGKSDVCLSLQQIQNQDIQEFGVRGEGAWNRAGVIFAQMRHLPSALYVGQLFDNNTRVIIPKASTDVAAVYAYAKSGQLNSEARKYNKKLDITRELIELLPFDVAVWRSRAHLSFPHGLPKPHSDDPTQWLFNGHPKGSDHPLQVAVARLLGYRWPRQTGSSFPDCPALDPDGLEAYADADGIVCLSPVKGESPAADRVRALLAVAYGNEWSPDKQAELLAQVGYANKTLEDWLRDAFFAQHCELFHQRPFIWHIWDGLRNGFHALVNYHRLAATNGEGRRTLEKLIYTYLGDWIDRQRADQKAGVEGADARLAAAQYLKTELEKILEGEPPYDIFVRWKPLHQQPIGWEPDINDGVRLNIRPFMTARPLEARGKNACILRVTPRIKWEKDRGKEPHRPREDYPWFWGWDQKTENFRGGKDFDGNRWNDLHYSRAFKQAARERQESRRKETHAG